MAMRIAILFFSLLGLINLSQVYCAEIVNRIVAIVDDEIITLNDINRRLRMLTLTDPELKEEVNDIEQIKKEILQELIEEKLAEKKAKEIGIKISENEVQEAIQRIKMKNNLSDEELNKTIAESDMTFDEYKKHIIRQLEREKLISQEIRGKIVISDESIKNFYEMHKAKFQAPTSVRISSIFLPVKGSDIEKTVQLAKELKNKLKAGETFESLVLKYSEGPGKEAGGDLGYFEITQLHPELRKLVSQLPEGEVSDPFLLGNYVQLMKVTERKGGKERNFEEVKETIRDALYHQELQKRFKDFVEELKGSYYVRVMY
jgi:peptidyl-prolyl cis-trans isomerase SurA